MAERDYFANYKSDPSPSDPNDVDYFSGYTPKSTKSVPADSQPNRSAELVRGKPAGPLADVAQWIRQRTGLFEPPIYGPPKRGTQPLRELGRAGAYYGAEAASGLALGIPDIVTHAVTGDESLSDVVNRATGFTPTPREQGAAQSGRFITELNTAGKLVGPVTGRLPVASALKTILGAGLTFGGREAGNQAVRKVVAGEPFDWEGIHFEAGVGTLFGAGEVGLQQLGKFIRGANSPRAMAQWTPPEGSKMSPSEFRTWSRQQSLREIRAAKQAGGAEWERVMQKYAGWGTAGEQTATPRSAPAPSRPAAPQQGRVRQAAEGAYQSLVNRFKSIENIGSRARELGIPLQPGEDPRILSRVYLGVEGAAKAALENQTFSYHPSGQVRPNGEGLLPILRDYDAAVSAIEPVAKVRVKDLDDYANAKRTINDLQRKPYPEAKENIVTKEQVKAAQNDVTRITQKYGDKTAVLDDVVDRKTAYRNRILHTLVDSGNLSEKQYQDIVRANPHYTPFDRILGEESAESAASRGPFTKAKAPIRKIKGSERAIANSTESDIKNTYRVLAVANRNRVARSIGNLADVFPDEINPVKTVMRPIRVDPSEIKTSQRTFVEKAVPVVQEIRASVAAGASSSGPMKKLETVVKEALIHRGMTEGEAGNYVRKLRSSGAQTETPTETATRVVTQTERVISEIAPEPSTIWRPSQFAPKGRVVEYYDDGKRKYIEVSKNLHDAMTSLSDEEAHWVARLLGIPSHTLRTGATITPEFIAKNPYRDQWSALMNTNIGFVPFVDSGKAIADMLGDKESYYAWLRSGGAYSGFVELTRPGLKKAVKELTRPVGLKMLSKLNIITSAEDLSQFMERATRVGAFQRAEKAGQADVEAAYTSREATTDFARRGSRMKNVNSAVAFFNAGIQGTDRALRAAKNDPVGFLIKGLATMTLPSIALYLRNRKDPTYFELPRWQRDMFYPVKVDGTWLLIPKVFGYGQIFSTMPERFMEYADTRNPKAFDDLAKTMFESVSPVSGDPAGGLLPTAVKGPLENAVDKNFFLDRSVVPESKKDLIPELQYGRYTSETSKALGKFFGYSPSKIDHLIRSYFGGSGRYATNATDYLLEQIQRAQGKRIPFKMPDDLADKPLLRGVIARPPEGGAAQSFQDFYTNADEITKWYQSWRSFVTQGDLKSSQALMNKHPDLILGKEIQRARTEVGRYLKAIDVLMRDTTLSDQEKIKQIRGLEQERFKKVREYNNAISAVRRKVKR